MSEAITRQKLITDPYFALAVFIMVCWLLPLYCGGAVTLVACASLFTAYVVSLPEQFRNRSGSMMTAIGLVTALGVAAVVCTAMTLMGEIR